MSIRTPETRASQWRISWSQVKPFVALVSLLVLAYIPALPQSHPVLTQYERQRPVWHSDTSCKTGLQFSFTTSKLTVLDSRDVVYETSKHVFCEDQVPDPPLASTWDTQSDKKSVFAYVLSAVEFAQLEIFLDRREIKATTDFLNAGPGVGDFKIVISRLSGLQTLEAFSLNPSHLDLIEYPALVHLVCRAKEMARVASNSAEIPNWCKDLKPLTGKVRPWVLLKK